MTVSGYPSPSDASQYETFYGLVQSPFSLAPDPRFLYLSTSHDAAIRQVLRSIHRREAFIVLSGDIGTGKSTLCRAVVERLDRTTFSSLILNPFLSVTDLLRQVLVDLGVVSREALKNDRFAAASKQELTAALSDFLASLSSIQGSAVLILDEAQHLTPAVLEELRVISSMAIGEAKLLQIVFVGQPNLLDVLAANDMRQLDQRISLRATLAPMSREDVEAYISHRLTVAGESVSVLFEPAAVKRVHALSGGVPRVINLLCDRALMTGAELAVYEITPEIVDRAWDALAFRRTPADTTPRFQLDRRGWIMAGTGTVAVLLLGVLLFAPLHGFIDAPAPAIPPPPARTIVDIRPAPIPAELMALAEGVVPFVPRRLVTPVAPPVEAPLPE